jgi:hypothetical protein
MKRLIALLLMVLIAGTAQAQDMEQGEYEAEDTSVFSYSGTWTSSTSGFQTLRSTTQTTATVIFDLADEVCFLTVYATSSAASGFDIDLTGSTIPGVLTYTVVGNNGHTYGYIIDVSAETAPVSVSMNMNSAGTLVFDRIRLLECIEPTATRIASSTPFSPVATATAVSTATPPNTPVPTATILPSSTPGVPTATAVSTATPPNTPVDTATAVPTATPIDVDLLLTLIGGGGSTLTPSHTPTITNTPTETYTPTPEPWAFATTASGQLTRFDYVATASDVHIANIITLLIFSLWAMFFFAVFVLWKGHKK